ncbi:hypothetical protein [Modestobacter altitudinis]|uniref:hypothetical protein n=1 Tax=Modestobacter altitudinis TaxID=2213158 RepID=UPI00110CB269|nr:hypothetical protein [Modestobacter altitudinis]
MALLVAGLVLAVVLLLLLLARCGGEEPAGGSAAGAGATTPAGSAPPASTSVSRASGRPSSLVAADGTAVLDPAAPADPTVVLSRVSGQTVTGTAVQVLSVPADEGFWIGRSTSQRLWVQLTGPAGGSPDPVRQGDLVDLTGTVVAHDAGFAAAAGVDDAGGAAQLVAQGQHVEVDRADLQLS